MKLPTIGEIWRKHGPCDWVKVVGYQLPNAENYDGGMPGVSILFRNDKGNWGRTRWFWPCKSYKQFRSDMKDHSRYPHNK